MTWQDRKLEPGQAEETMGIKIHTQAVLKKFAGDIPEEHRADPEAHGHKVIETVIIEDGKPVEVILGEEPDGESQGES
jgi:hypothetical protein